MNEYKIRVVIESRWGETVAEACVPLSRDFREVIQPLKLSDGAMPFLDTPPLVVQRVKQDRKSYGEFLTPQIAKVLLDAMSAKDLFNGYTKDELKG